MQRKIPFIHDLSAYLLQLNVSNINLRGFCCLTETQL